MKLFSLIVLTFIHFNIAIAASTWSNVLSTNTQTQDSNMQIELVVNSNEVNLSDTFELTIRIKQKWSSAIRQWMFNVEGFEPFDVVWDRTVSNTNIVNWEQASLIDKILSLKAKNEWVFVLGPVKIDNKWKPIISNQLEIKVWSKYFSAKAKNGANSVSKEGLITDSLWINDWKIDYFKMIFSFEICLLLLIIWFSVFLYKSKIHNNDESSELTWVSELVKENRVDFLDQCLKVLQEYVLKNWNLKAISVSDWELGKIWNNYKKRITVKEVIDEIYTLKAVKQQNIQVLKKLRSKVSNLVL